MKHFPPLVTFAHLDVYTLSGNVSKTLETFSKTKFNKHHQNLWFVKLICGRYCDCHALSCYYLRAVFFLCGCCYCWIECAVDSTMFERTHTRSFTCSFIERSYAENVIKHVICGWLFMGCFKRRMKRGKNENYSEFNISEYFFGVVVVFFFLKINFFLFGILYTCTHALFWILFWLK